MLQSIWNLSIKGAGKEIRQDEAQTESFCGIFDIKFDCSASHKETCLMIDQFATVEAPRKLEGSSVCLHSCKYRMLTELEFNSFKQGRSQLLRQKDLFATCIDLLKKTKNVNCTDKFY